MSDLYDDPLAAPATPSSVANEIQLEDGSRDAIRAPSAWLDGLNDGQRQAVENLDGAVLVLAGAGTGKTRVLTTRLAELISGHKAQPQQILCVTFTNKAAREMRDRVEGLIGKAAWHMWLGTFHSLGAKILREHAALVGLKNDFTILDSDDQIRLIKRIIEEENIQIDIKKYPPRLISHIIQRYKDRGELPDDVRASDEKNGEDDVMMRIYDHYQARLKFLNAADFGDLLLYNLHIFKKHHDILKIYQEKFHYILVDEYQDTNLGQYYWLRLLSQYRKNICCVGDDDQSIYGWRGAEIGNILKFSKDFPEAKTIRLERNYRSTSHILSAASGLIAKNSERLGKELYTEDNQGEKLHIVGLWDHTKESRFVIQQIIKKNLRDNLPYKEMAILVRAGFQTREFEEKLLQQAIPYRVVGGARFYEREEIRDAVAYLRLAHNMADNLAFERIINKPKRGIGDVLVKKISYKGRQIGQPYLQTMQQMLNGDEASKAQISKMKLFLSFVERWREWINDLPPAAALQQILEQVGYYDMWRQKAHDPQAEGRLENLHELIVAMNDFSSIGEFLEHVSLVTDNDSANSSDVVSLMTLHAAKGLEFDSVFLAGWEEGMFPNQRGIDEGGLKGVEEERRLAYVGITRAKKSLYITHAANRLLHGNWINCLPSRFLSELPMENIHIQNEQGLSVSFHGGGGSSRGEHNYNNDNGGNGHHRGYAGNAPRHSLQSAPFPPPPMPIRKPHFHGHASKAAAAKNVFQLNEDCYHTKFGRGIIIDIDGDTATVNFEEAGNKKLLANFLQKIK